MSSLPTTVDRVIAGLVDTLLAEGFAVPSPPPTPGTLEEAAAALFSLAASTKASLFSVWAAEEDEAIVSGISFFFVQPDAPGHAGLIGAERKPVRQHFAPELYRPLGQAIAAFARRGFDSQRPGRGTVSFPADSADPDLVFRVTFEDDALGTWVIAAARDRETRAAFPRFSQLALAADEAAFLEDSFLRLDALFHGKPVLFTGEKGTGRSDSLHAAMEALPDGVKALAAMERPRAFDHRIGMIQLGGEVTLAGAVRALLRQDPDLVFADEARTPEDLHLLANAVLTGHATAFVLEASTPEAALARLREAIPDLPLFPILVHHALDAGSGARTVSVHITTPDAVGAPSLERWSARKDG